MDTRYLTAIALSDTYQPGDRERGWEGVRAEMAVEHAFVGDEMLCGLHRHHLMLMRHYWRSSDVRSCQRCKAALVPPAADSPELSNGD